MKFQLLSDVHLEYLKEAPKVPVNADYLILAGDIGYPTSDIFYSFMRQTVMDFKRVFYVPGNHEYYEKECSKREVDEIIDELADEIGFINLNMKKYELGDLTLLGATLWTETNTHNYNLLSMFMNDYKRIRNEYNSIITPWDTGRWHYESVTYIQRELEHPGKKIVVTHHLPSERYIHPGYKDCPINCGFYSNLDYLFNDDILAWCSGHTHCKVNDYIGRTKICVNPLGYPGENKDLVDLSFSFDVY